MNVYLINILIIPFLTMTTSANQDYIDKHISEFESAELVGKKGSLNHYNVVGDFQYLGKPYKFLFLFTDEKDIVKSYDILLEGDIDRPFFDLMIEQYGNPDAILSLQNTVKLESSTNENGISANKVQGTLLECKFEENPLFIRWFKKGIQIRFDLKPKDVPFKKTIISFGVKT